jgi:dipeptidyl aminopeptidase/acylaminoacyl peptidase
MGHSKNKEGMLSLWKGGTMRSQKFTVILLMGIVLVTMLACAVPLPTPVEVTDTPGVVLPPPAISVLRVVYIKAGDVWVWSEGGSPLQLTSGGDATNPRLSADGQLVAFNRGGELWVVNVDGSGARVVVDLAFLASYAMTPGDQVVVDDIRWLSQTHLIVFNTLEVAQESGYQVPLFDFKVADGDAGIGLTTSPGEGGVPYVSPDASVVALAQPDKLNFFFSSSSTRVEAMTFPLVLTYSEWLYVPELVWLPDSSAVRLVVPAHDPLGEPDQVSTFWDVPVSGSPTRLATFLATPAYASSPFISPDGQKVVYQVDVGSNTEIHTITAGGVDTLALSYPINTVRLLGWHPDSIHFMFSQPDLFHANLGSTGSSQLLGDTPQVQKIRWINDTRYIFVNSNELRLSELGGASVLIDTGVNEYDFIQFSE